MTAQSNFQIGQLVSVSNRIDSIVFTISAFEDDLAVVNYRQNGRIFADGVPINQLHSPTPEQIAFSTKYFGGLVGSDELIEWK